MSITELARAEIRQMTPYQSARMEADSAPVALDANENPWTLFGDASLALNRYPQPQPAELVAAMAETFGVAASRLLLTHGSDEGIDLLVRTFCRAGVDQIVECPPCFGMYRVAAAIQGVEVQQVPLQGDYFALDIPAIIEAGKKARILFLCSPNNPTGNALDMDDVFAIVEPLRDRCVVVVDQAYSEFAPGSSLASFAGQIDNLVVLRTLSKAFGLAGIRCGAVIAAEGVLDLLRRVLSPYPLPTPTIATALQAMSVDQRQLWMDHINRLLTLRMRLSQRLSALSYVERVWPSQANFVLARFDDGPAFYALAKQQGVVVRNVGNQPGLENCLRITVGSEQDLDALDQVFDQYEGAA